VQQADHPVTTVHLLRHGEVYNPQGILYGRLPDYRLSERGLEMARTVAEYLHDVPLSHLVSSPLQRARETMSPIAATRPELEVHLDPRVIEATNEFEGQVMKGMTAFSKPANWWLLRNPLRPSWGEPFIDVVARMRAAIAAAAESAGAGGQALIVSHQLPIWMARSDAEGRRLLHDPRRRECTVASITSLELIDGRVTNVRYAEPARHLLPDSRGSAQVFSAGS